MSTHMKMMTLYVTSACNLQCEECIMGNLMAATKGYQMSIEELTSFIVISEQSSYQFNFQLSGGEPLIWKHLQTGLQLLRCSTICNRIEIFTNAMSLRLVNDEVIDTVDLIRVSEYTSNRNNIGKLQEKYGNKIRVVNREKFWKNPREKVPESTPAECLNPECMYMDYKIYACPHSASIAEANRSKVPLFTPLEIHYLDRIPNIRKNQEDAICTYCISNNKIRKQLNKFRKKDRKKDHDVKPIRHSNISLM